MGLGLNVSRNRNTNQSENQSQSSAQSGPWDALQPFVQQIYGEGQRLYNQGPSAGELTPLQQTYLQRAQNMGQGSFGESALTQHIARSINDGGPDVSQAQGVLGNIASGGGPAQSLANIAQGGGGRAYSGRGNTSAAYGGGLGHLQGIGGQGVISSLPGGPASSHQVDATAAGNYLGQALGGLGLGGAGTSRELDRTASGAYLGSNPYLDATYDRAAGRLGRNFQQYALPGVAAAFGGAGRAGSPAHQRALENTTRGFGESLSDLGAGIYGPAYEAERGRQFQGGLSQAGFEDAEKARRYGLYGAERQLQAGAGTTQAQLSDAERGRQYSLFDAERGRQLQGSLGQADLADRALGRQAGLDDAALARQAGLDDSYYGRQANLDNSFYGRQAGAAGQFGQLGLGAGQSLGNLGLGAYGQQTGRQAGAAGLIPGLQQLGLNRLGLTQDAANYQRAQADQERLAPWDHLNRYSGVVGQFPFTQSNATSSSYGSGSGSGSGWSLASK